MDNSHIARQLSELKARISEVAGRAGRTPASIRLVAVSKTFPPEAVLAAHEAGQRDFGENRVQEMESKAPSLPDDISWHLIGHLQGNKARKALDMASWIHSVDSPKLLNRLDQLAAGLEVRPKILVEVNLSGEGSKTGSSPQEAETLAEEATRSPSLEMVGLMTMSALDATPPDRRRTFAALREMRDRLERRTGARLPELSMGMSSDFEEAILEGSTMLRVGTAIFGRRE